MSKYTFDWSNFTKEDFVDYCAKIENNQLLADDYVGCVRVGDLCFDLVLRLYPATAEEEDAYYDSPEANKLILTYDLYVGGVDSGYGYSDRDKSTPNYPYDFAEGSDFDETCIRYTYEDFQTLAEEAFTEYINHSAYTLTHNLIDKALEPLHIW